MGNDIWHPLPIHTGTVAEAIANGQACVLPGKAAHWPAVRHWSWERLAALAPEMPVRLVRGNRELHDTAFHPSTLGTYLRDLQDSRCGASDETAPLYLKEFDLLRAFPQLQGDVHSKELFPPGALHDSQTWIGPANGRTGLHHDFFDNLAVQIMGHKRFYLVRPGVVERLGLVSTKYDQWAVLASAPASALASDALSAEDAWVADLAPGDVLYVPARWWHEVVNHSPSVLLSGFFGPRTSMYRRWLWRQCAHAAHLAGLQGRGHCTCHPARGVQSSCATASSRVSEGISSPITMSGSMPSTSPTGSG